MAASDIRVKLSHEDLERLFVKNAEVSVELGQGVAEAFAKRYLSTVVKSAAVVQAVNDITIAASTAARLEVEKNIGEYFAKGDWPYKNFALKPEHKIAIENAVRSQAIEHMDAAIKAAFESLDVEYIVAGRFNSYIDRIIESRITISAKEKVKARVREELEKLA